MEMLRIISNPGKVFESIEERTFKPGTLIIVSMVLVIIVSLLNIPINNEIMILSPIAAKLSPEQIEMVRSMQSGMQYIKIFIDAIQFLVKMGLLSLLLWGGTMIFKGKIKYTQLFSLLLCSYLVVLIGDILNVSLLYMEGFERIENRYDIYNLGLNIFFDVERIGSSGYMFLSYVNLFQIWFLCLLTCGIHRISGIKWVYSLIVVIIFWLMTVAVPILMSVGIEKMVSKMGVF